MEPYTNPASQSQNIEYWPKPQTIPDIDNPLVKLKEVAAQLPGITNNKIFARIETLRPTEGYGMIHYFVLEAPTIGKNGHRSVLFKISQKNVQFFPMTFLDFSLEYNPADESNESPDDWDLGDHQGFSVSNMKQFDEQLRKIISSENTQVILSTLMTLSNQKLINA